jgi:hypothetical protein
VELFKSKMEWKRGGLEENGVEEEVRHLEKGGVVQVEDGVEEGGRLEKNGVEGVRHLERGEDGGGGGDGGGKWREGTGGQGTW